MANADVYSKTFAAVIEQMERGVAPWVRPWTGEPSTPYNALTGRHYSGGNVLALWFAGMRYTANGWVTFKQALEAKCVVRKGEKATPVYFMSVSEKRGKTDEGEEAERYFFARGFQVFNVEQLDELEPGALEALKARHGSVGERTSFDRIEECEDIVRESGADVTHGGAVACYIPQLDVVRMPEPETFTSRETYYATLFHELTHWTGHEKRLDRKIANRYASPDYAFEELVAELGAAFLSARVGLETVTQSAAYLGHWAKACKAHPEMLAKAASLASRAADFLAGAQSAPVEN